nr:MAG TPA: hypothetical protein [Caudoviricetes sp.]
MGLSGTRRWNRLERGLFIFEAILFLHYFGCLWKEPSLSGFS